MSYIDEIALRIASFCEMSMNDAEERRLLLAYAVLALTVGTSATLKNVHDAWSAWRLETRPEPPFDCPLGRAGASGARARPKILCRDLLGRKGDGPMTKTYNNSTVNQAKDQVRDFIATEIRREA